MLHVFTTLIFLAIAAKALGMQPSLLALVRRPVSWMIMIILPLALLTQATIWASRRVIGIFWRKLMSVLTVSSSSVLGEWIVTAQGINAPRNGFKMNRIHTRFHSAQMIGSQLWRVDDRYKCLVDESLGANSFAMRRTKLGVSVLVFAGSPQPARNTIERHVRIYLDFAEKANKKFEVYRQSVRMCFKHRFLLKANGVGLA